MFKHREEELKSIRNLVGKESSRCKSFLIYGRRRIGKSLLVREAMKDFDGIFIDFIATDEIYENIVQELAKTVSESDERLEHLASCSELHDILLGLKASGLKIVLGIDEYPYMKKAYKRGDLDSVFLREMEHLTGNITIGFLGSYINIMEKMIKEDSPLYGRFDLVIKLKPFNYLEAASFYPELPVYEKLAFYAIFGGMPFALDRIDPELNLKENIKALLLDSKEYVFIVLSNVLLEEIRKVSTAEAVLKAIGNGKSRNSELASSLNMSTSLVAANTAKLMEMNIIEKKAPINREDDRRKEFYEISDNLTRFYYTFIFPNITKIETYGAEYVWRRYIEPGIGSFIARQFEGTAREYFIERIRRGLDLDTEEVGTYWYDLPEERRNGEFDCVLKQRDGFAVAECKFLSSPMQEELAEKEAEKIRSIPGMKVNGIAFVSATGFDFSSERYQLISGEDLYML